MCSWASVCAIRSRGSATTRWCASPLPELVSCFRVFCLLICLLWLCCRRPACHLDPEQRPNQSGLQSVALLSALRCWSAQAHSARFSRHIHPCCCRVRVIWSLLSSVSARSLLSRHGRRTLFALPARHLRWHSRFVVVCEMRCWNIRGDWADCVYQLYRGSFCTNARHRCVLGMPAWKIHCDKWFAFECCLLLIAGVVAFIILFIMTGSVTCTLCPAGEFFANSGATVRPLYFPLPFLLRFCAGLTNTHTLCAGLHQMWSW